MNNNRWAFLRPESAALDIVNDYMISYAMIAA